MSIKQNCTAKPNDDILAVASSLASLRFSSPSLSNTCTLLHRMVGYSSHILVEICEFDGRPTDLFFSDESGLTQSLTPRKLGTPESTNNE